MIIAANASDNIAAAAAVAVGGGIYQGSSLNLSYSNSTTTVTERNPSIQSVVTDDDLPAAPGLIHREEDASSRQEESESLGSNSTTTTTKTEAQVLSAPPSVLESSWVLTALTPADQQRQQQRVVLDSREESESGDASYGVEDQKDRSWSPSVVVVLGPSSLVDETTKPGHMNQAAEDEEKEAEAAATAAAPVSPTPSPAILPLPDNFQQHPSQQQVEKFLMPILSYQVGAGNQLMEYMSAAIVARALNRTLCLPDFFPGPTRHTGTTIHTNLHTHLLLLPCFFHQSLVEESDAANPAFESFANSMLLATAAAQSIVVTNKSSNWEKFFLGLILLLLLQLG